MAMIKLTYRELAQRLGISPDAARMKAKRKIAASAWRMIPGNHPQDKVYIELPEEDVPERAPDEEVKPKPAPAIKPEAESQVFAKSLEIIGELQGRVTALTEQLLAAKDAHRVDAIELAGAREREAALRSELERAASGAEQSNEIVDQLHAELAQLQEQLAAAQRPPRWRPRLRLRRS